VRKTIGAHGGDVDNIDSESEYEMSGVGVWVVEFGL
jgi:hypothetical protein